MPNEIMDFLFGRKALKRAGGDNTNPVPPPPPGTGPSEDSYKKMREAIASNPQNKPYDDAVKVLAAPSKNSKKAAAKKK